MSGAIAATAIGTAAVAAGWDWGILLALYFVVSSALSAFGRDRKNRRIASMVQKSSRRDAWQVMANGGVFGAAAVASLVWPHQLWHAVAVGALAASAADTWATEVGTLYGGQPRSVRTWKRVQAGTSGAVTLAGTLAMVGGALFIAGCALALHWPRVVVWGAILGGLAGAAADTAIGATLQERRRCMGCGEHTERRVHLCGSRSRRSGGIAGVTNDTVNVLAATVGAGVAAALADVVHL